MNMKFDTPVLHPLIPAYATHIFPQNEQFSSAADISYFLVESEASPNTQLLPDNLKSNLSSSKMMNPDSNESLVKEIYKKFRDFELKFHSLFFEYSTLVASVRNTLTNPNTNNPDEAINYTIISNRVIK